MRLAICGCGVAGLAAANLARRAGFEVSLFDQFDAPAPVGSGLVIQPMGLRILNELGAGETALAKGAKGYRMSGHEALTGRKVLDVSYGPQGGAFFGLGIHRASLFEALLAAAKANGATIIGQHRVTASHNTDQGRILSFDTGQTAGPFDLVIDTMGAGSPLSPLRGKPLPYGAIWGTVDWPEDTQLHTDQLQQSYRRASNMVGILPIGTLPGEDQQKAALFWSLPRTGYDAWRKAPIAQWQHQARDLWPALAPFISQITDHAQMTFATYSHGGLRRPYGDRIVYIGDAAHRASPQLGQGANMALLDASALIHCLRNLPLAEALPRYVKARRLHVALYQTLSWAFTPMYQSDSRILPLVRDHILGPLSVIPPVPAFLTRLVQGNLVAPARALPEE